MALNQSESLYIASVDMYELKLCVIMCNEIEKNT